MFAQKLFWRFFGATLAVVIITAVCSVTVERALYQHRVNQEIIAHSQQLIKDLDFLRAALVQDDIASARHYYRENPYLFREIRISDVKGQAIFPIHQPRSPPPIKKALDEHPFDFAFNAPPALPTEEILISNRGIKYIININPRLSFFDLNRNSPSGIYARLLLLFIISAAVCGILAKLLIHKIRILQNAVRNIAQGNYSVVSKLRTLGEDELGALANDVANMAEKIEEHQKSRKQMLSDISHELRSPLARINVATSLAKLKAPEATEIITRIDKEAQQMNKMIGQIIHIQQAGLTDKKDHRLLNLANVLRMIVDNANYEIQRTNKTVVLTTLDNLPVQAQQERLASAIENIVRNGLKHSPENGKVLVSATTQDEMIHITISDSGAGVPEAEIEKIFAPFVRLDLSRNRKTGGYGLGLAIAHAIICDELSGKLSAHNLLPPQHGLVVEIVLPTVRN